MRRNVDRTLVVIADKIKEYAKSNTLFFTTLEDEINNLESESVDTAAIVLNLLKDSEFGKEENKSVKLPFDMNKAFLFNPKTEKRIR